MTRPAEKSEGRRNRRSTDAVLRSHPERDASSDSAMVSEAAGYGGLSRFDREDRMRVTRLGRNARWSLLSQNSAHGFHLVQIVE